MYKMPVVSKYFGTHILCILYVQHMHCSCINDAEVTPSVAFICTVCHECTDVLKHLRMGVI